MSSSSSVVSANSTEQAAQGTEHSTQHPAHNREHAAHSTQDTTWSSNLVIQLCMCFAWRELLEASPASLPKMPLNGPDAMEIMQIGQTLKRLAFVLDGISAHLQQFNLGSRMRLYMGIRFNQVRICRPPRAVCCTWDGANWAVANEQPPEIYRHLALGDRVAPWRPPAAA